MSYKYTHKGFDVSDGTNRDISKNTTAATEVVGFLKICLIQIYFEHTKLLK